MSTIETKHALEEVFKKHSIYEVYVRKNWNIADTEMKFYIRSRGILDIPQCMSDLYKVVKMSSVVPIKSYDSPLLFNTMLLWTETGWRL